ncbi:SAM-dependent methyltransferase [Collibacillus ludicampi]|uniref:SAM-dependent methyltransferase n=2 Tax=Collibacillus ludicampi TaxID=2771369 RepID=A0AAV4LAJ1_9BACL|nr:SAM-dependent methyltransferase [Collibacillus ludicampi]
MMEESMKISKRLGRISEYVPFGSVVADIGSDHALVPIQLVTSGKVNRVIAGEVNDGPFQTAIANVSRMGLQHRVDVRKGDGLEVVKEGEVSVVIIAGMGGGTIVHILAAGRNKLSGVERLILQPQGDADRVRLWLGENGWMIYEEDLLMEDELLYEIIVAEPGVQSLTKEEEEFGPILLRKSHPLLQVKLQQEIEKAERVLRSLERSNGEAAEKKRKELERRKNWLQEVKERVCNRKANY